ncbi:hypothetical protein [Ideonella sp.]|uniref:hypothetical protein n=1 Tax=Ideonella sp. TaxID=1929293 RepID=UPI002B4A82F6|nr:hypothetical protein [Ideonella sp.]HJV67852.1 hypothetical protein [Ideonella sp.]
MSEFQGAAALAAACMATLCPNAAQAAPPIHDAVVAPAQQATRDDERVRILQDELAQEQIRFAEADRRHAQRLAQGDDRGAQEAEQARSRAAKDLAALKRELEAAQQQAEPPARPLLHQRAHPPPGDPTGAPRWWDVYAKRPAAAAGR